MVITYYGRRIHKNKDKKKKKNQDEVLIMRSIHVGNGVAKQELGAT